MISVFFMHLYITQHPMRVRLRKVGLENLNTLSFLKWMRRGMVTRLEAAQNKETPSNTSM